MSNISSRTRLFLEELTKDELIKVIEDLGKDTIGEEFQLVNAIVDQIAGRHGPDLRTLTTEVLAIYRSQGKLSAIKQYRYLTNSSLKDSKEAVEDLIARHTF